MPSMSAYLLFRKRTVYALLPTLCIVHGMDSTSSTVVLLLSVCTGCTGTVLAVSVYYCSSKNVYSTFYIILRLRSKYYTILRFIDGTEYSTIWNSEFRYGKWYHFANPCSGLWSTPLRHTPYNCVHCTPSTCTWDTLRTFYSTWYLVASSPTTIHVFIC